jgi:hypothetical protein
MPIYFTEKGVKAEIPAGYYRERRPKGLCAKCAEKDKRITELEGRLADAILSLSQYRRAAAETGEKRD